MISVISGTIEEKNADSLVVMTPGGVGFLVIAPTGVIANAGREGDQIRLYTYLYIREDIVQLIGFGTQAEREMFKKLTAISGVGPKAAIAILSALSMRDLALALATGDAKAITRAQGVGKKLAERIILELRGKVETLAVSGEGLPAAGTVLGTAEEEAAQGLMALGYTDSEALSAIAKVAKPDSKVEEIIFAALKTLDR